MEGVSSSNVNNKKDVELWDVNKMSSVEESDGTGTSTEMSGNSNDISPEVPATCDPLEEQLKNASILMTTPTNNTGTKSGAPSDASTMEKPESKTLDNNEDKENNENKDIDGGKQEDVNEVESSNEKTETISIPKWSEVLATPSNGELFSPSRDLKKSLHGKGLTNAVARSKILSTCGKRCAALLSEVSALHENYALSIQKSCESIVPRGGTDPLPCFKQVSVLAREVTRCLVSFAKQTQGLAICIKGSIARPLHASSSAALDTAPNVFNRYMLSRSKSHSARILANKTRLHYVKSVKDAENAIRDLKRAKSSEGAGNARVSSLSNNGHKKKKNPSSGDLNAQDPGYSTDKSNTGVLGSNNNNNDNSGDKPATKKKRTKDITRGNDWKSISQRLKKNQGLLSKSSDNVIRALNDVQENENQYCAHVKDENESVSTSHAMEKIGLEALQDLEEERLHFFHETLQRLLQAEKGALDNMSLSLQQSCTSSGQDTQSPDQADTISNSNGLEEAQSLDLPETVGRWRDSQMNHIFEKGNRSVVIRLLATFFEDIASATDIFSSSLVAALSSEGYCSPGSSKTQDQLVNMLDVSEGPRAMARWNKVIKMLESCSASSNKLAQALRNDGHNHLDTFLLRNEKEYKLMCESESTRWKYLCETARNAIKAKTRYEAIKLEFTKANERMTSMETEPKADRSSSSQKLNPAMSKALGNMFSILPNGGEEAMSKILTSEQRKAIAETSYQDAMIKEARERSVYAEAENAKNHAIESYCTSAETCDSNYKADSDEVWNAVTIAFADIMTSFQRFRDARSDSIADFTASPSNNETDNNIILDIVEWTDAEKLKLDSDNELALFNHQKKQKKKRNNASNDNGENEFALNVQLEDSKGVYNLINLLVGGEEGEEMKENPLSSSDHKLTNHRDEGKQINDISSPVGNRNRASTAPAIDSADLISMKSDSQKELISLAETIKTSSTNEKRNKGDTAVDVPTKKSTDSGNIQLGKGKKEAQVGIESGVFLAHFWDEKNRDADEPPPTVIESFSCAYWPKENEGFISPLLHGRMFCTSSTMYFVGWGDKKIIMDWEDVITITKETTAMGTVPNALLITFDSGEGVSSYFFGSFAFRENAFRLLNQLTAVARSLTELTGSKKKRKKEKTAKITEDKIIKKMDIILNKKLRNVSVQRFYELCWSEGTGTECEPFYLPFLEDQGNLDVSVSDWQIAEDDSSRFLHEWSGEYFSQKREVNFNYKRTSHLYIGPPIAQVKQTHFCTVEGDDKFVLVMTYEMSGIPYADFFAVEVRWVVRREGASDLRVEVGVFVDFKKQPFVAGKIRTGTISETKPAHEALFYACRKVCQSGDIVACDEEDEEKDALPMPSKGKIDIFSLLSFVKQLRIPSIPLSEIHVKITSTSNLLKTRKYRKLVLDITCLTICAILWWYFNKTPSNEGKKGNFGDIIETEHLSIHIQELKMEIQELREVLGEVVSIMKDGQKK